MDIISRIFNVLGELARLVPTLLTNGVHFIALCAQSRTLVAKKYLRLIISVIRAGYEAVSGRHQGCVTQILLNPLSISSVSTEYAR